MKSEVKTKSTCTTKEVVFDFAGRPVLGIEFRGHHKGMRVRPSRRMADKPRLRRVNLHS